MGLALSPLAIADRKPSDEIPGAFLHACEKVAMQRGAYAPSVAGAADGLSELGVFTKAEFRDVKIGYCDLRSVDGPVATTSCARDIILLDTKYADEDEAFTLKVTLAHEMKHYFQLKEQKSRFGEGYCTSERFKADKAWLETEADTFGDNVIALLVTGRSVEIKNECPASVAVYLEFDKPVGAGGEAGKAIDVAPNSTVAAPGRSVSNLFRLYARSEPHDGRQHFWRDTGQAHIHRIDAKLVGLKRATLSNRERSTGPFQLRLSCSDEQGKGSP